MIVIPDDIPCLSAREPWAWLLVNGPKDIENRTRRTKYRGQVSIHASAGEVLGDCRKAADIAWNAHHSYVPQETPKGGIIGMVNLVDCVTEYDSPWFFGPFGWVMADAVPLEFIPCKGRLGFWKPPTEVLEKVRVQLMEVIAQ